MDFFERAARNETVFRNVNQQIEAGAEQHGVSTPMRFHCECDRETCFEQIDIDPSAYQRVIEHRYRFAIAPGHDDPRIEHIVDTHEHYCVVEKTGAAREALDRHHPQTRHQQ